MMGSRHLALRIPHLLAQVEACLNPALRGRAFVVATGREPRSQVLGLSPAQSADGCGRGAPLAAWLRTHPELLVVESRPERADALLARVRTRIEAVAPGLREARAGLFLLDLRGSRRLHPDESALGCRLLDELRLHEGLVAAGGIGSSPLAARLLARRARAGELHTVDGERERALLDDFPLAGLPELSATLLRALAEAGIRRVGEARCLPPAQLLRLHGEAGQRLLTLLDELGPATAGDPRGTTLPLVTRRRLPVDSADPALLEHCLIELLEVLHDRARRLGQAPRRLELALLWNDGLRQRRGIRLLATADESRRQTLRRCGRALLGRSLAERRMRIRELEAELTSAPASGQLSLLGAGEPSPERAGEWRSGSEERREERLDTALGQLRGRWGPLVVRLGLPAPGRPGPGRAA